MKRNIALVLLLALSLAGGGTSAGVRGRASSGLKAL